MEKTFVVPSDVSVVCPWCLKENTLKNWDDNTFKECKNREMKRDFMHLQMSKTWLRSSKAYFKCPDCGQWVISAKLKIANTTDARLLKLGGEPLVSPVGKGEMQD